MSQTKIQKTFDCLQFKQEAQERIYQETKEMTPEEQIEYFKQAARSGTLGQWWQSVTESHAQHPPVQNK